MRTLVFATNNKHKLHEVSEILRDSVLIKSLSDIGLEGDIPETAATLQGNALQKAQWVWERTHTDCFADDTGLEVEALNGAPESTAHAMRASTAHSTTTSTNCSPHSTAAPIVKHASALSSV